MMKMCFNKGTIYEQSVNVSNFTQFLGMNCIEKERIFRHLSLYCTSKRAVDIELFYNDEVPSITVNGERVSKGRFEVFYIKTIDDLDFHLSNKKDSCFNKFCNYRLENYYISKRIDVINQELQNIVNEANEDFRKFLNSEEELPKEFSLKDLTVSDIIKNNITFEKNIELSNFEKYVMFIKFIINNYEKNLQEQIIIFNNIDCFLTVEQYKSLISIMEEARGKYNIYFFVATSKVGYNNITMENITYATIFNKKVFDFPSIDIVTKFLCDNYPINKNINDKDVIKILNEMCHYIYSDFNFLSYEALVCTRIFNSYENIKNKGVNVPSKIELKYLQ